MRVCLGKEIAVVSSRAHPETAGRVREIYTAEGTAYGQAVRWYLVVSGF